MQLVDYLSQILVFHIFNLLTNNGNIQGMYMTGGKLYWNGAYIKSKSITTAALAADPGESKRPGVGIRAELRPEDHQYSE